MLGKIGTFASKAFKTAKANPIKTTLFGTGGVAVASHMMGKPGTSIQTLEERISPEEAGAQAALMDTMNQAGPMMQVSGAQHMGMMMGSPAVGMVR